MSHISRAANAHSALNKALNNSPGGFSSAELSMLNQLSGQDKTRMQQHLMLAKQQETMTSILKSLKGLKGAIKHTPQTQSAGSFNAASIGASPSSAGTASAGAMSFPSSPVTITPDMLSTDLSKSDMDLIDQVKDPQEHAMLMAQRQMEKQQEVVGFISNLFKKQNDIAMSIIGNMK